jgi:hypothetical protein
MKELTIKEHSIRKDVLQFIRRKRSEEIQWIRTYTSERPVWTMVTISTYGPTAYDVTYIYSGDMYRFIYDKKEVEETNEPATANS